MNASTVGIEEHQQLAIIIDAVAATAVREAAAAAGEGRDVLLIRLSITALSS